VSDEIKSLDDMEKEKASKLEKDVVGSMSSFDPDGEPELIIDQSTHRYECRNCGYVYDPSEGIKKFDIPSGTAFLDLDQAVFRCPVCRLGVEAFRDIGPRSSPSGFQENLKYGFGINNLTPGQKNVLIFGGLAFAFACFLSLYSLH